MGTLWKKLKCAQQAHWDHIDVYIVIAIKMSPVGTLRSHWWVHCDRNQNVPTGHIGFTWPGSFWMYSNFPHWAHCDHFLTVITMYSACTHRVFDPLPPVRDDRALGDNIRPPWRRNDLVEGQIRCPNSWAWSPPGPGADRQCCIEGLGSPRVQSLDQGEDASPSSDI